MNRIEKIFKLTGLIIPSVIVVLGVLATVCAILLYPNANHQFALGGIALLFGIITFIDEVRGE